MEIDGHVIHRIFVQFPKPHHRNGCEAVSIQMPSSIVNSDIMIVFTLVALLGRVQGRGRLRTLAITWELYGGFSSRIAGFGMLARHNKGGTAKARTDPDST